MSKRVHNRKGTPRPESRHGKRGWDMYPSPRNDTKFKRPANGTKP